MKLGVCLTSICLFAFASPSLAADWTIEQKTTGLSYETKSSIATRNGVSKQGLLSVYSAKGRKLVSYWEKGAHKPTVELDGKAIVDGKQYEPFRTSRSHRLTRDGKIVFLEGSKKKGEPVYLNYDGAVVKQWPYGTTIRLYFLGVDRIIYSQVAPKSNTVELKELPISKSGEFQTSHERELGKIEDCEVAGVKLLGKSLLVEAFCEHQIGQGIYVLGKDRKLRNLFETGSDQFVANGLLKLHAGATGKRQKGEFGRLEVSGSVDGVQLYHGVNTALLAGLGEPQSVATDEAASQSWRQSYRTMALANLYKKTKHNVFAKLAEGAMKNSLSASNGLSGLRNELNPDCGWSSRIYSKDRNTPITLKVNQAMIVGSMVRACGDLGKACSAKTKRMIDQHALCLANYYEPHFDEASGLYKIQKDIVFRFDGIWAPWNWQTTWARVLQHVGKQTGDAKWTIRAKNIAAEFSKSVQFNDDGALWRYWPQPYYKGWSAADKVSKNKPSFRPSARERFEDIGHGGLDLFAVCDFDMPETLKSQIEKRLEYVLKNPLRIPRYLDGDGPKSARWLPAAGWDCLKSKGLKQRYAGVVPGGRSHSKFYTYTRLFDPAALFSLKLVLSRCTLKNCRQEKVWNFSSARDYISNTPFFSIQPTGQ